MPDIFQYNDFRLYLGKFYEEKKKKQASFSYQSFSRLAGFTSKSSVLNVIQGRKNLSKASIVKMGEALKLGKTEREYFEALVHFNQAKGFKEKNHYYDKLDSIRCTNGEAGHSKKLRRNQFEFYSQWYHAAIRSIIGMYPFKDNYAWLAKKVNPPININQAKKSVRLLENMGLIEKTPDGIYKITDQHISTGREIKNLAVHHFHLKCLDLAKAALEELPQDKRNISGLTLGISEKAYKNICEEIYKLQEKLISLAEKDVYSNSVYQVNFQIFPMTNHERKG